MLSKAEIQYLQGQKQVSKSFEYKLKHSIRKKVTSFLNNELPLLQENHILDLIAIKSLGKAEASQFSINDEQLEDELILINSIRYSVRDLIKWRGY